MRHHSLHVLSSLTSTTTTTTTIMSPPSSSLSLSKPTPSPNHKRPSTPSSNPNPNSNSTPHSPSLCNHHSSSPFLTLDLLILILVLFSGTFLITSYFSYIFHSLSLLPLPSLSLSLSLSLSSPTALYFLGFFLFFLTSILSFEICCGFRSRKCQNPRCKGMKKAMEFDLQLLTEECLRSSSSGAGGSKAAVREIDELPWKGGSEGNPDYECLRAELRKMAPPNGRAVLLFRAKCGCPIAKLEGWGAKRGRRHKKGQTVNGGGDYR